jgi:hypothetical protein
MSSTTSLTNELTGGTGIQTDHGGIGIGDLLVLGLDAVLLIYTAFRSYDFLSTTVPTGFEILGLIGLWGLDIGAVAWSLVWIFGSSSKYQDWISMAFFLVDLVGVILTSVTDSLMYGDKGSEMTGMLTGITSVAIPLVVVGNVVAGFIYHMTSPETKARREKRKAEAAHKEKMIEISAMERDLQYAESYLLAKQDSLDKTVLLAEIKKSQDAIEKSTRDSLRDQIGIRNAASNGTGGVSHKVDELKTRLAEITKKLTEPKADETPTQQLPVPASASSQTSPASSSLPQTDMQTQTKISDLPQPIAGSEPTYHPISYQPSEKKKDDPAQTTHVPQASIIPALQIPPAIVKSELIRFTSRIACSLSGQVIHVGDELVAKKSADRYDIGKLNAQFAFANVSEEDFNTLRNGLANLPEPAVVKGNGHSKSDPI